MTVADTIIVDLDGTLSNNRHRAHFCQNGDWDKFDGLCINDYYYEDVRAIVHAFSVTGEYSILACTGRSEKYMDLTLKWISKHNMNDYFDAILMRPNGNNQKNPELKTGLIEKYFSGKENALRRILFALDDDEYVIDSFRKYGITAMHVRPRAY